MEERQGGAEGGQGADCRPSEVAGRGVPRDVDLDSRGVCLQITLERCCVYRIEVSSFDEYQVESCLIFPNVHQRCEIRGADVMGGDRVGLEAGQDTHARWGCQIGCDVRSDRFFAGGEEADDPGAGAVVNSSDDVREELSNCRVRLLFPGVYPGHPIP